MPALTKKPKVTYALRDITSIKSSLLTYSEQLKKTISVKIDDVKYHPGQEAHCAVMIHAFGGDIPQYDNTDIPTVSKESLCEYFNQDDPYQLLLQATCLYHGIHTEVDKDEACRYYHKIINDPVNPADNTITGIAYSMLGEYWEFTAEKNLDWAKLYYSKGTQCGNPSAYYKLACLDYSQAKPDSEQVLNNLLHAYRKNGHAGAAYLLSKIYTNTACGEGYLQQAAYTGHQEAILHYADRVFNRRYPRYKMDGQDKRELCNAFKLVVRLADTGHVEAMFRAGQLYHRPEIHLASQQGQGLKQSKTDCEALGRKYFKRAAECGHLQAQSLLAENPHLGNNQQKTTAVTIHHAQPEIATRAGNTNAKGEVKQQSEQQIRKRIEELEQEQKRLELEIRKNELERKKLRTTRELQKLQQAASARGKKICQTVDYYYSGEKRSSNSLRPVPVADMQELLNQKSSNDCHSSSIKRQKTSNNSGRMHGNY